MEEKEKENVHKGHRKRLRQRFREYGLDNFNAINALELLLFYVIPQGDVNPLAHDLLERFGSLQGVFEASEQELRSVTGVGERTAELIRLVPQIMRRSLTLQAENIKYINSSEDAGNYFLPRFMTERDEVVYLLCLDSKNKIINCQEMGRGVVNAVETSIRKMVETALKARATSVILAHNHPDGLAIPSTEDDMVTRRAAQAFALVGVHLADHIIVADDDFVSYRDSGMMRPYNI